jgi:hypothetical protein
MRSVVIAIMCSTTVLLAGCVTTHTRTASAADELERSAESFAAHTCYDLNAACSRGQQIPGALAFAERAHEFRQTLDTAGDQDVVSAYKRLWRSYHTLRDDVYRLHDGQLQADLKPLTRAFVDVQRNVKTGYSYADPALYAAGAYTFNPYYN